MKVKVRTSSYVGAPARLAKWGTPETVTGLVVGTEYEVCAFAVFSGVALVTILHGPLPWSFPIWLFDVTDDSVPDDWIARSFSGSTELDLVMGPPFIAKSSSSYFAISRADIDVIDEFLKYFDPLIKKIHQELDEEEARKKRFGLK